MSLVMYVACYTNDVNNKSFGNNGLGGAIHNPTDPIKISSATCYFGAVNYI